MLGLALAAALSSGVPFTLQDHRAIVQAYIGNAGPFSMIVDTGSAELVVTPAVAQRLGLHLRAAGFVSGAGAGKAAIEKTTVTGVRVGNTRFAPADALVLDLSRIQRGIGFSHFDGVIGYEQLQRYRVLVDMDRQRIAFLSAPIAAPPEAVQTPFARTDSFLRIPATVDGVHGTFVVDTGDRSQLTLFRHFADANGFAHFTTISNALTGFGVGGPVYADMFRTTLQTLGVMANDVVTRIPVAHTGAFATAPEAGSIGNGFLERFNVVYDYPDHRIVSWPVAHAVADTSILRLPAVPLAPSVPLARHAILGAAAAQKTGGVTVTIIAPNGPAYAAGLRVGDVIRSMGDRPIVVPADFYQAAHDATAGRTLDVSYVRDRKPARADVVPASAIRESYPGATTTYGSVTVDNSLRRTLLTVPTGAKGPVPAVLIIGGIGCYSVDVAASPQDPYMNLSRDLAHAGYATVRIDKSGVGDSQGPPCAHVDFDAEVRGYRAALASVRTNAAIDPKRIYLFGHSIGSVIAPRLALEGGVAGIIVAEGVGRDWPEYEIRNLRRDLELDGSSPAETDRALIEKAECMQKYMFDNLPEVAIEAQMPSCKVHNSVYPVSAWYMRQVAGLNVIEPWTKLDLPVLLIYGASDFETELADHQRIADVVDALHPKSATVIPITGMSHFLGRAATPQAAYAHYGKAIEEYDSQLSDAVIGWLQRPSPTP
jgi:alpha-beta hydrolase superfamily lysophospholipase/predicted aspartyl protease